MTALPPATTDRASRRCLAVWAFVEVLIAAAWVAGLVWHAPWAPAAILPFVIFYGLASAPLGGEGRGPGSLFFYDAVRLARRGRGTLLRCGYALVLLGMLCGAWRSHFPEVPLLELGSLEGRWVSVHELPRFAQSITLALLLSRLYGPLTALSNVRVDIMSALVSFDRVFEVLDLRPMIADRPGAVELPRDARSVEFDDVRFTYPSAAEVSLASLEEILDAWFAGDSSRDRSDLDNITHLAEIEQPQ